MILVVSIVVYRREFSNCMKFLLPSSMGSICLVWFYKRLYELKATQHINKTSKLLQVIFQSSEESDMVNDGSTGRNKELSLKLYQY